MRLVKVPDIRVTGGLGAAGTETRRPKRKIKLSWEDLLIAFGLIVLIRGLITKEFTSAEVLSYLGFAAGGGVWGYVSGNKSTAS